MKAVNGGAIYHAPVSTSWAYAIEEKDGRVENYKFEISNCLFERCTAQQHGGSLFFKNTQLIRVAQSEFSESKAGENGGAIYFWCDPVSIAYQKDNEVACQLNLASGLDFTSCSAKQGGGIYWNFIEPTITPAEDNPALLPSGIDSYSYQMLTFEKCTASEYGPQIAGVARELAQISNDTYNIYYDQRNQDLMPLANRMNVTKQRPLLTSYRYGGVQSGGNVPISWFCLLDQYG